MSYLWLGLLVFLGVHSIRLVADDWRSRCIARIGKVAWKGLFSAFSVVGFALIVWGYGVARQQPVQLWSPPAGMPYLAALLTWLAFVLLAAAYIPRNYFKARLYHPMLLATKVWALAHLLANGTLAGAWLFGSFLVWAVVMFASSRRRDRRQGVIYAPSLLSRSLASVLVGTLAWAAFTFALHGLLIGILPLS
ncbi:MAG: NnrU family protein [Polaromonas sp.]|nr:NnrU family protein [Polaromonas sp.]